MSEIIIWGGLVGWAAPSLPHRLGAAAGRQPSSSHGTPPIDQVVG
ncbi:hypothetical protein [Plantibacter flavus]|nr:hypothetical protein [Plantibacter flavus]